MSDFDLDDVLKAIKDKVPGAFEVYQSLEFFGYRQTPDGREEKFLVKVLDAGPSGGDQRYHVKVTTESGGSATGNPADDIIGTLIGVHMWDLDRVDAEP